MTGTFSGGRPDAVVSITTAPSMIPGAFASSMTVTSRGEVTTALIPTGADRTLLSSTDSSGQRKKTRTGRAAM